MIDDNHDDRIRVQPRQAALLSALHECLCCLGDLRLRLWNAQRREAVPSCTCLGRAIAIVEHEAKGLAPLVPATSEPITLVSILDTMTIHSAQPPHLVQRWTRSRLDALASDLDALGMDAHGVTELLLADAARRIERGAMLGDASCCRS